MAQSATCCFESHPVFHALTIRQCNVTYWSRKKEILLEQNEFTVERKQIVACGQLALSSAVIMSGQIEDNKFTMSWSGVAGISAGFGVVIEGVFNSEKSASGTLKFSCAESTTWNASKQ